MDYISVRVGENIRRLRLQKGISQTQLARLAGIHSKYLGEVERAEKRITVKRLHSIVTALDVKMSLFFQSIEE